MARDHCRQHGLPRHDVLAESDVLVCQGETSKHPHAEAMRGNDPLKRSVMPASALTRRHARPPLVDKEGVAAGRLELAVNVQAAARARRVEARPLAGSAFGEGAKVLDRCVQIPGELQLEPERGVVAEVAREADRGIGRNAAMTADDFVHSPARDAERTGKGLLTDGERLQKARIEEVARVLRRARGDAETSRRDPPGQYRTRGSRRLAPGGPAQFCLRAGNGHDSR